MKILIPVAIVLIVLVFLIWLGLKIQPAPFPAFAKPADAPQNMPLPKNLPAPVERFYRQTYGETVPLIHTAVLSGRGKMAPFGLWMPLCFGFIYEVGKDYRALIQTTFFNLPLMGGDETYINGDAIGRMPTGTDEGPWFDEAMNVRVWIEMLTWLPAALLNDARVQWMAVDDEMALLGVPFGEKTQWVVVRFDPQTGKISYVETMKARNATTRVLWINSVWLDQGKPWVVVNMEDTVFNVDVSEAIHSR